MVNLNFETYKPLYNMWIANNGEFIYIAHWFFQFISPTEKPTFLFSD